MSATSLTQAMQKWNISGDSTEWRRRMLALQTNPPPSTRQSSAAAAAPNASRTTVNGHSNSHSTAASSSSSRTREQLLEDLRLEQLRAEARVQRLKEMAERREEVDDDDEDDEEDDEEEEEESGSTDQSNAQPAESSPASADEEDEEEAEYENELDYLVHEVLCVDAINHDLPSGEEVPCPLCKEGKKFASEYACSACSYVRGVCSICRRVVVLRTLEDPSKGVAACMALLSDSHLLRQILEVEDEEEEEAIRGQINAMLEAYFNEQKKS